MDRLNPGSAVYNVPSAFRLRGSVDPERLSAAVKRVVDRHESLRTTFREDRSGQVLQIIHAETAEPLEITRLTGAGSSQHNIDQLVDSIVRKPFDLETGPLFRAHLFQLGDDDWVMIVNVHHIVADGLSLGVFSDELAAIYRAWPDTSVLGELPIQYPDFTLWEHKWLEGTEYSRKLEYWKKKLDGSLPVLQLPTDYPRPGQQSFAGSWIPFEVDREVTEQLQAFSRQRGVSLFTTLMSFFYVLLHRYTGQDDLLVGTPFANRRLPELENLIGFFVNTVVNRTSLDGNPTLNELVKRVKETTDGSNLNGSVPFERLVESLVVERDISHNPLFQVMFTLQEEPLLLRLDNVETERLNVDTGTSKFDLLFELWPSDRGIEGRIEYASDLFHVDTVRRMSVHFATLLGQVSAGADTRISDLAILDENEAGALDRFERGAGVPQTGACSLIGPFEARAAATPDAIAVQDVEGHVVSYIELNERANKLAHFLIAAGAGPEICVGVCMRRTPELLTSILGILKSGAAYVPLDPDYPAERTQYILSDSGAALLVTQSGDLEKVSDFRGEIVAIDRHAAQIDRQSAKSPDVSIKPQNLAYVIYTSGSTGKPKGVAIEHHNVIALLEWSETVFTDRELECVLASTSICFDLSVFEIFLPLWTGGRVVLAESALDLLNLPDGCKVTLVNTVPSVLTEVLSSGSLPESVCTVNLAGEPLSSNLVDRLYDLGIPRVYDLYGPSETTTYSTYSLRRKGGPQTIGRPVGRERAYVLDQFRKRQPVGIPGELYIGGAGVARGYYDAPDLTGLRFVPDPFSEQQEARMYRTGDIARWRPDGQLEFIGRRDNQVKIRGFRIELGEIETVLRSIDGVHDAVVIPYEAGRTSKELVAYLLGAGVSVREVRDRLRKELPQYMVPSIIEVLDAFPMTPNGKIDRTAFPVPGASRPDSDATFVPPRNDVERKLVDIWSEVTGIDQIGIHDDFFELGGHSLMAVQLFAKINNSFSTDLRILSIFAQPTIAELAEELSARMQPRSTVDSERIII